MEAETDRDARKMNKPSITVRGFNVTDPVGIKSVKKYLN
jgi:hypothetical protein